MFALVSRESYAQTENSRILNETFLVLEQVHHNLDIIKENWIKLEQLDQHLINRINVRITCERVFLRIIDVLLGFCLFLIMNIGNVVFY